MPHNQTVQWQAPAIDALRRKQVVIASHSGSFHADDIYGTAVLSLVFPNNRVIRTRDVEIISAADFAVDVGGVWNASAGRFDHHQKDFAGRRENGVVFASAGLVWSAFGEACLAPWTKYLRDEQLREIAASIDSDLVQHLDRADTGASMGAPGLFGLSALLAQFNPTWLEESSMGDEDRAQFKLYRFNEAVSFAKTLLERIIADKVAEAVAANLVPNNERLLDGRVLLLGDGGMPWFKIVCETMPEVLYVIYPDSTDKQYQLRIVPVAPDSFKARLDLPREWAGLRDADLAAVTGVSDAAFCHNACFIAGAYSLDGAVKLAELALQPRFLTTRPIE